MKFQSLKMRSYYSHKVLSELKIANKLKFPIKFNIFQEAIVRRLGSNKHPAKNIGKTSNPGLTWCKRPISHDTEQYCVLLILLFDKIIFYLTMLLITIRLKNKIPAFAAKAGGKPVVFQLF